MSATEKIALINEITLKLAEDYSIKVSELKDKITVILTNYHVTISDEAFHGQNLTTEYLFNKFADGKMAVGMTPGTIKQYSIAINKLETFVGKRMSDMEAEDINRFLRDYGKTVSTVTLRAKYQLLSSVYNWLSERHYIPHNPIAYTDAPRADVIVKNPLTDSELESIKRACETLPEKESLRNMALVHFFVSTGCRINEVRNIKISDLNLETKTCIVMGKGRKERTVIISDKAKYRLDLYLKSRRNTEPGAPLFARIRGEEDMMSKDGIERIMHRLRVQSGVTRLTCHVFRRFYATELRKRAVPLQMIAKSLGHANLNQIQRYSLLDSTEMVNVIRSAL